MALFRLTSFELAILFVKIRLHIMALVKRWLSLLIKHGAPVGLFFILPMLVALYLGHNVFTTERDKHISLLTEKLENNLSDIGSEVAPESFLLKVGRGIWYKFCQNKHDTKAFADYYRSLPFLLGYEPDIYVFDKGGNLITPDEFKLKSKFIAKKIWEAQDCSYEENASKAYSMKKQFKSFLGNEFRLGQFIDGRDRLFPIIVNTKPGYVYWMNSENNHKEGIMAVFWEIPSMELRLNNILDRYALKFDKSFVRDDVGRITAFAGNTDLDETSAYDGIFTKMILMDQTNRYLDSDGLVWNSLKFGRFWLLGGLRSRILAYDKYNRCFVWLVCFFSLLLACIYMWAKKKGNFYISIKVKLVSLFLIAVFTPVMGFAFIGYQYVEDMHNNLKAEAWNDGRDLLLNIDRELGHNGNYFRDDFRKIADDFLNYNENPKIKAEFNESLKNLELGYIERRLASDASLIDQKNNLVLFEGMSEVAEAFAKCCIDSMLNTNLMDSIDSGLSSAMKSPECGLTSFWVRPDNVQDFIFGRIEFYQYWDFRKNKQNETEYVFILRLTDKVLRDYLKKRLLECKNNPKEKNYLIFACNDKNGEWFPDNSLASRLKVPARRIQSMERNIETKLNIGDKDYLLTAVKSKKLRGYSFYALYPYENVENALKTTKNIIIAGILLFIVMACIIGVVLSGTFLYPIQQLGEGVKALKARNSEFRIEALQNDEFGDLAVNFNKMIGDLNEMELAKCIQEALLPSALPKLEGYELAFNNRMASAVGGDYFDVMQLDKDNLCIIIGDVSGHGVASAIVMAIVKAVIYQGLKETRDLIELFNDLNSVINTYFNKAPVKKMVTLFATIINLSTGEAVFTDAGHNFPMKLATDGNVTEISMRGFPVGAVKSMKRQRTDAFAVNKGETIVFYTDGLIEVTGHSVEQYGYERLKKNLSEMPSESPEYILNTLFNKYDSWLDGTEPDDDVTCLVLKRL